MGSLGEYKVLKDISLLGLGFSLSLTFTFLTSCLSQHSYSFQDSFEGSGQLLAVSLQIGLKLNVHPLPKTLSKLHVSQYYIRGYQPANQIVDNVSNLFGGTKP